MLTDPLATAGLVTRELRTGSRDGAPTKIAIARRTYATDQADLWDALTERERIPRWFLPISGDLGVGGRYQLEGNAGGVVERCDAPESFAVTWEYGSMVSWLVVTLTPDVGSTTLELAHEAHVDPEMGRQFGPGAVGVGWDLSLMGLGWHIETGESNERFAEETWALSDEGKAFATWSSKAWTAASIAYGTAEEAANRAGITTTAFYTGAAAPE
jgi:uncharacterized protein YndB with AHSA1/START domain